MSGRLLVVGFVDREPAGGPPRLAHRERGGVVGASGECQFSETTTEPTWGPEDLLRNGACSAETIPPLPAPPPPKPETTTELHDQDASGAALTCHATEDA